jgi:REP element-mobilizing transposase RayT
VFTRPIYRDIVIDSLKYCQQKKGLQIFGYVIMSNHIHLIANSPDGHLSETLRDLKKLTTRTIINAIKEGDESRKELMLYKFVTHSSTTCSDLSGAKTRIISCGRKRTMQLFYTRMILFRRSWSIYTITQYEQEWLKNLRTIFIRVLETTLT